MFNNLIPKNLFSKIPYVISRIFWSLGKRAFLVILIASLLSALYGLSLYYKHVVLTSNVKPMIDTPQNALFKENIYFLVIKERAERKATFEKDILENNYPNPFSEN